MLVDSDHLLGELVRRARGCVCCEMYLRRVWMDQGCTCSLEEVSPMRRSYMGCAAAGSFEYWRTIENPTRRQGLHFLVVAPLI